MALEPTKHVDGRMWPRGRPLGSRTVFSQAFLKDLAEVWPEEVERRWGSTKSPNFAPELAPEANGSLCASDGRAQKEAPATEFSGAQGSPLGV
jgi:hypothetical protein